MAGVQTGVSDASQQFSKNHADLVRNSAKISRFREFFAKSKIYVNTVSSNFQLIGTFGTSGSFEPFGEKFEESANLSSGLFWLFPEPAAQEEK